MVCKGTARCAVVRATAGGPTEVTGCPVLPKGSNPLQVKAGTGRRMVVRCAAVRAATTGLEEVIGRPFPLKGHLLRRTEQRVRCLRQEKMQRPPQTPLGHG